MKSGGLHDRAAAALASIGAPFFRFLAHHRRDMPRFQTASDRIGFQIRTTGYYEPTYDAAALPEHLGDERNLPGLDLGEEYQLKLLAECTWQAELRSIPEEASGPTSFGYRNGAFSYGDADMLYNIIRRYRPARIIEIGSGQSTLMARLAIEANRRDAPSCGCAQICIEPYEMPWLESLGVTVIRDRVEHVDMALFATLGPNDILFIDSSHVIRPYGDVLKEFQEIVPSVAPGVIVHAHDIFTPRDYPERWVRQDRRLWNEQYLLESFLAFNDQFQILSALNWLKHRHPAALASACGFLRDHPEADPGSFWFRRKLPKDREG